MTGKTSGEKLQKTPLAVKTLQNSNQAPGQEQVPGS